MIIIHCLLQKKWEEVKRQVFYGKEFIELGGFIHCSSMENFWRVATNFKNISEPMVLLCIDTDKVLAPIKWADHDHCGREYPHIYGELNINAVVNVVPFLRDDRGIFILNEELR